MNLLKRLFGGSKPIEKSYEERKVRDDPGPFTAREAWEIVRPGAVSLDPGARLTFITSGLDLTPDGRSFTWEFGFELLSRTGHAMFSIQPDEGRCDPDEAPVMLAIRTRPALPQELGKKPGLPETFRDSPAAVEALSSLGVDFAAGPGDMKLETRCLPSGEFVWLTYDWDEEKTVPLTG